MNCLESFRDNCSMSGRLVHLISPRNAAIILAAAVIAFVMSGLFASSAWAQISPGPLSKAHSFLSGPLSCTKCHEISLGSAQFKCLDCHTEIRQRLASHKGLHAYYLPKGGTGKDCVSCHSEHNGRDFNLIHWRPSLKRFDHSKTGYSLIGRHSRLACNQCHNEKNIPFNQRQGLILRDLNRTFLGLSRNCASCHADEHHGQLGADCASCHTEVSWKPATKFNHASAKFALTGAHTSVACEKCHVTVPAQKPYVKYVGIPFAQCSDCHTDPHHGVFHNRCESCHDTRSWKQIGPIKGFDHSKTPFPLLGGHRQVPCEGCHKTGDFKTRIAFNKCIDCHLPDPHHGQFARSRFGADCSFCHTVESFKATTFTVQEHAQTNYALEGKHAAVPCEKCHIPRGTATIFAIHNTHCASCHEDIHKGQFSGPPHYNKCEDCHTVQGFRPAKFTLSEHNRTPFPLTGAHVAVPCNECHKIQRTGPFSGAVKFRFKDRTCTVCHNDPHNGQFVTFMKARLVNGSPAGCRACHITSSWLEISNFNHPTKPFPLLGAHKTVPCARCHQPSNPKAGIRSIDFKAAPTRCAACHASVHGGQFAATGGKANCERCHDSVRWSPSLFNHETQSRFPLKGAHEHVACGQCHNLFREVMGKRVLFYKPTPTACSACHGPDIRSSK